MRKIKTLFGISVGLSILSPIVVIGCEAQSKGGHGNKITPFKMRDTTIFDDKNAFSSYKDLSNKVEFSTDPSKPNLIEIFADGLDPLWTQSIIGDKGTSDTQLKNIIPDIGIHSEYAKNQDTGEELHTSLKDFTSYPNFFTGWVSTLFGKAGAIGGRDFNVSNISQSVRHADKSEDFEIDLWRAGSENDAMRVHMIAAKDNFSSATIFSENDTCRPYDSIIDSWKFLTNEQKTELKAIPHSDLKTLNYGGDGTYAKKLFSDQNINFYTKKDSLKLVQNSKDQATKDLAPLLSRDSWATFAAMDISKINNTINNGGRLFIQHSISHTPRDTNYDGTRLSSPNNFDDPNGHNAVTEMPWRGAPNTAGHVNTGHGTAANLSNLRYVVEKLKNLKDNNGRSVYDNSMIVVFGDHSDHERANNTYTYLQTAKFQSNSELLIKFPDQKANGDYPNIDINHTVWGGDMNKIINDYFNTMPTDPTTIFNDKTFALDRPILIANREKWNTQLSFGHLNQDNKFIWDGETTQNNSTTGDSPKNTFSLYSKNPDEIYNKLFN